MNKPSTLEEMKQTAKKLDETALNIANFKSISCPKYYSDLIEKNDIIHCFVSSLEPEALIPLLSQELEKFANVDMGWRMDVGIWTTFRSTKDNGQKFSFSLTASGMTKKTREDPQLKNYKTIARCFISYDDNK
ncbi:hypothetical protein EHF33_16335 (plasmid) [Deinococcus psychrotolerans]|uniref:Uncharacterized protein n=1 Tax=Deinococcus psychrotolerans TaxID=2489213 RepID=A0A3G8YHK9_9DEIO|nr:hypothetical protein [Deinococcus psychrotolerans]AZI44483.1 hypothetical protein EHF33_16335 [Deinococcus psychrotolerans]